MKISRIFAALALCAPLAAAQGGDTVADWIAIDPNLDMVELTLKLTSNFFPLMGDGPFTVFAPINEAFDAEGLDAAAIRNADPDVLQETIEYHIISENITLAEEKLPKSYKTLAGPSITIFKNADGDYELDGINGKQAIVLRDKETSNGMLYEIDTIMRPPGSTREPTAAGTPTPAPSVDETAAPSPSAGEATESPTAGDATSAPSAGDATSAPSAGDATSAPSAGEATQKPTPILVFPTGGETINAPTGTDEATDAPTGTDDTTDAPSGTDDTTDAPSGTDETTDAPTAGEEGSPAPEVFELTPMNFDGCMEAEGDDDDDEVTLEECTTDLTSQQWEFDSFTGLIRTKLDEGKCLQAGEEDGDNVRIFGCNEESDLQQFEWSSSLGSPIKLKMMPELCIVFRGTTANDGDPIITKNCADVESERLDWMAT